MTAKKRQKIERRIVRKLLKTLVEAGFVVNIDHGTDEPALPAPTTHYEDLYPEIGATDEQAVMCFKAPDFERPVAFVSLVFGNDGYDVITDHTMSLSEVLRPVFELSDRLEEFAS